MKQSVSKGKIFTPIFRGGLGNNLYQIAATLSLARTNDGEAIFYKQSESDEKDYRPFGGHRLVEKKQLPASLHELFPGLNFYADPQLHKDVRSMGKVFKEEKIREFEQLPKFSSHTILEGYFFSHQYFSHDLPYIQQCLKPDASVENYINDKYGHLLDSKSVSLHLRMGNDRDNFAPDEIPLEWYRRILRKLGRKYHYLVCSDDISRAKSTLTPLMDKYQFHFINKEPMYIDLFVMARCRHHILHSSTLSAWSALLISNDRSKVYVHDPLFARMHGEDTLFPGWIAPGRKKRLLMEWWSNWKLSVLFHFQSFINWLKELKRNFMHRFFGIYYILDHEKEDHNRNK